MKASNILFIVTLLVVVLYSCKKDDDIDTEKPDIDLTIPGAFPANCDTMYFGESFNFNALFKDNYELGSFSIDIHNNFDGHSHSTEITQCESDPEKDPVNPYVFIDDYDIPVGLKEYNAVMSISIPAGNTDGLYDEGDYHFFISLTDKEGWSAQKGLNIKLLHR